MSDVLAVLNESLLFEIFLLDFSEYLFVLFFFWLALV